MKQIDFKKYIKVHKEGKKHALYAPSAMDRTLGCAGSIRMAKKFPPQEDSEASIKGTNAHTLLEFFLREGEDGIKGLKHVDAMKFKRHIGYSSEQHQAVRKAYEFVRIEYKRMWKKYGIKPKLLVERKVYLDDVVDADCNGTGDVFLYIPGIILHIIDYKNGVGVVQAEANAQLLTYGLGFIEEKGWDFPEIRITIIQPNAPTKAYVRTWTTNIKEMKRFKIKLIKGIEATKDPRAPLKVDSKWCFFCPAKKKCPAQNDKAVEKIKSRFIR